MPRSIARRAGAAAAILLSALGAASSAAAERCPMLESAEWSAWIELGEDGASNLVIAGRATLPTPGWRAELRPGPMDRALPPGWILALDWIRPEGAVIQVLSEEAVILRTPTREPRLRVVRLRCGDDLVAELRDVGPKP